MSYFLFKWAGVLRLVEQGWHWVIATNHPQRGNGGTGSKTNTSPQAYLVVPNHLRLYATVCQFIDVPMTW